MPRDAGCPVCGDEDCRRHRALVTFATLLNVCAMTAAGLLIGLLAAAGLAAVD
jgi:hypothetical protein